MNYHIRTRDQDHYTLLKRVLYSLNIEFNCEYHYSGGEHYVLVIFSADDYAKNSEAIDLA